MSMAASSSHNDPDSRSLQVLLEAFGSRFTLDDIASAYCQASRNVDVAGEILFSMSEKMPQSDQIQAKKPTSNQPDTKAKSQKPKRGSTSIGTVSSVISKEYVRTRPLSNPPKEAFKPMKIDSKVIPETEIWGHEMPESNGQSLSRAPPNVEDFIVKMLKEGFQASQDVIDQTLSVCGYDVKNITEKLLDLSYSQKYADAGISNEVMSKFDLQRHGSSSCNTVSSQPFDGARTGTQEGCKDNTGLEKEVLEALFSGTKGFEVEPKVTRRIGERRARAAGRVVFKPLEEDHFQERVVALNQSSHPSKDDEDDEKEYELQRKAVHRYWHQMKLCYGAAVEAFSNGEIERAHGLVEKGHVFGQKAREADDKSIAKIIDAKKDGGPDYKEDEVVRVSANELEPKDVVRLVKLQLKTFSGISSFKYLTVKLGENKEDSKFKKRRIAIVKLLDGESIGWSEEDSGLVMMIRLDEIDPKKLSFVKK